jgi:hypothetical protein
MVTEESRIGLIVSFIIQHIASLRLMMKVHLITVNGPTWFRTGVFMQLVGELDKKRVIACDCLLIGKIIS